MSEFIELRGGLIVPADAVALLVDLERRGITCSSTEGGVLRVKGPKGGDKPELSAVEVAAIKARKAHLLALVAYEAPA